MVITRHGEGTFRIQTTGTTVVIDPSDNRIKADVTIQTQTPLPLKEEALQSEVIIGPGEYDLKGVRVRGFSIPSQSKKNVLQTAYEIMAENLSLVFLGGTEALPDTALVEKVGDVDILFAPPGAVKIAKQFESKYIIPTHVASARDVSREFASKIEHGDRLTTKKKDLPATPQVFFIT